MIPNPLYVIFFSLGKKKFPSKLPLVLFFVPNPLKFHKVYQPMGLNSTLCWTLSRHFNLETHLILGHFLKNFFNDSLPLIPVCILASILIIQILAFPNWSSYFLIISLHSLSPCLFKLPLGRFLHLSSSLSSEIFSFLLSYVIISHTPFCSLNCVLKE